MKRSRSHYPGAPVVAAAPDTWTPVLDGELAARTRARAVEIGARLLRTPFPESGIHYSLGSGSAGLAVVHAALFDATGDPAHRTRAAELLAHARDAVRIRRTSPTLYSGFPGVAWAVQHLGADPSGEILAGIDAALGKALGRSPWRGPFDLIGGLVGLGVYGLERRAHPGGAELCERVVDRLAELAEARDVGVAWHTPATLMIPQTAARYPYGYDNLGLAHGTPGVIALLGACCAAGVAAQRAARLLDRAVAWVLAQRLDVPGARFPACRAPGEVPRPMRTAWCYGDAGVAAALLLAARGAGRPDWERIAVEVARDAARRSVADSGVIDTTLCHGAAGLALVYARMHHTTGDPALADAARIWFARIFEVPDYVADDRDDFGLLMGPGGVALALLAGTEPRAPDWDRALAISAGTRDG